jgi:cytochrome c peroxidase
MADGHDIRSRVARARLAGPLFAVWVVGCSAARTPPEELPAPATADGDVRPQPAASPTAAGSTADGSAGQAAPSPPPLDPIAPPDLGAELEPLPGSFEGVDRGPLPGGFSIAFTEAERELFATLSPLPPLPPDPTNRVADDPAAAELGRALFEDPELSGPLLIDSELGAAGDTSKVSCATCHFGPALDDPAPVSTGTGVGARNALALVNSSYQRWVNWGGRFSSQWELSVAVIENPKVMNGSRLRVAHRIFDAHRERYEAVFGPLPDALASASRFPADGKPKAAPSMTNPEPPDGAWEMMDADDQAQVNAILVDYGKAIGAFLRTLVSRSSRFDRFVEGGELGALDLAAQQGLRLFVGKARCISCHDGPLFSDGAFHAMGVQPIDPAVVDSGRYQDIPPLLSSPFSSATEWSDDPDSGRLLGLTSPPPEDTRGQFRTPSLRTAATSAPYMHNGAYGSLEEVVDFYDWGGDGPEDTVRDRRLVPLHLTAEEKQQLVAFLHSLTPDPIDPSLTTDIRPTW